jgi:hypothetical protein
MSKIALSGNASGTGTLTIAAPNTNSDATINLPTVTGGEFIVSNASGNVGIGTSSPSAKVDILTAGDRGLQITGPQSSTVFLRSYQGATSQNLREIGLAGTVVRFATAANTQTTAVERALIESDGSQFSVIPGGSTLLPAFPARAWVNFNGSTASIRASGNVSSVTRNSTGNYSMSMSTAMPDANYSITATGGGGTGSRAVIVSVDSESAVPTTTSVRFQVRNADNSDMDCDRVFVAIHR